MLEYLLGIAVSAITMAVLLAIFGKIMQKIMHIKETDGDVNKYELSDKDKEILAFMKTKNEVVQQDFDSAQYKKSINKAKQELQKTSPSSGRFITYITYSYIAAFFVFVLVVFIGTIKHPETVKEINIPERPSDTYDAPIKKSLDFSALRNPDKSSEINQKPLRQKYVRPITAPNGQPWPVSAGYVRGYEFQHIDGLSTVTIDNSLNDSDVFVKLISLDGKHAYPVRQFYIPAFGRFTLNNVTAGSYDIRYRDLSNGGLSRSESFNLKEIQIYNGTQFSNITMTLYKVQNGNMQTYDISESEF